DHGSGSGPGIGVIVANALGAASWRPQPAFARRTPDLLGRSESPPLNRFPGRLRTHRQRVGFHTLTHVGGGTEAPWGPRLASSRVPARLLPSAARGCPPHRRHEQPGTRGGIK